MKEKWVQRIPLIGAVLVLLLSFFVLSDSVGLANNGDFYRVMKVNRISFADDTNQAWEYESDYVMELEGTGFFKRLASTWSVAQEDLYDSPQFLLVKFAKSLNYFYNVIFGVSDHLFRIEMLSGIYILLLALSAWGILSAFQSTRMRIGALALLLFVFCDMGYLLYFHSFYGEALQFVSVMILLASMLHLSKKASTGWFFGLLIGVYFLAGSKLANIPYGLCILIGAMILVRNKKWLWISGIITGLLMVMLFHGIPDWMNRDTTYQSVFFGILKESPTPEEDLKELGLPSEYSVLQNTHAYFEEYPIDITSEQFREQFFDKMGKGDVVLFYLKHPLRFIQKLSLAISYSGSIRPPSLANSGEVRMGMTDRYSIWSHARLKSKLLYTPWVIWFGLIGLGIGLLISLVVSIRKRKLQTGFVGFALLWIGLCVNLVLPIAGNGEADLAKHMFFMIHLVDIGVCCGLMYLLYQAPKWKGRSIIPLVAVAGMIVVCVMPAREKTVEFGGYQWTVLNETEETQTLVCQKMIAVQQFDNSGEYGSNLWEDSDLREFLNTELFSKEEYLQLLPMTYQVCVSNPNRKKAEEGWHPMIWTHHADTAASLWQDSFRMTVTDRVALLTLTQYEAGGFDREIGSCYWLADPYGNNDSMVRYADSFGQVLHQDANQIAGVRPVITIKK